jgi:hypothetical protein
VGVGLVSAQDGALSLAVDGVFYCENDGSRERSFVVNCLLCYPGNTLFSRRLEPPSRTGCAAALQHSTVIAFFSFFFCLFNFIIFILGERWGWVTKVRLECWREEQGDGGE